MQLARRTGNLRKNTWERAMKEDKEGYQGRERRGLYEMSPNEKTGGGWVELSVGGEGLKRGPEHCTRRQGSGWGMKEGQGVGFRRLV